MKDKEQKVKATEEVKEEVQTEENGVELTDEELSSVAAGNVRPDPDGRNQPESDTRADFELGGPLNIQCAVSLEQIFRQSKQKSERIVDPIRMVFVTNDGKDAADSPCDEFLEVPLGQ